MTLTRRQFCSFLVAAPVALPTTVTPDAASAATLHAQATRLIMRGKLFERAARYLSQAAAKEPRNPAHPLALGCAYASRAASLVYAATATKKLAENRASYGERVKSYEKEREDTRKNYPQFYDPADNEYFRPRLPPAQVYATKDDNLSYRLTPEQCKTHVQELTKKAHAAWTKGMTLSASPQEKALAWYIKGWGLRVLRELLQDFLSPLPPEADIHNAFEQATLAAPDNPLYWQAKADALASGKTDAAKTAYLKAVALKPRNAAMLWYRLYSLSATKRNDYSTKTWSVAEGYLQKAQAADQGNAWPLYEQAGILFRYAPYALTGASGPRNAPESVMEPLRSAVRNEAARKNGREAIDLMIEGNQASFYAAPQYRESVPDLLAAAWHYFHPFAMDSDGYARVRELARAACSYGQFLAQFEKNGEEAERAGRASVAMGWRLIGNWFTGDGPTAEQTILCTLVGGSAASVSYKMLLKIYQILDEPDKADALQTEMDAFDRIAKVYRRVTSPRMREDYLPYY